MIKELKPKHGQQRFKLTYGRTITQEEKEFLEKVCNYFDVSGECEFITFAIASLAIKAQEVMDDEHPTENLPLPLEMLDGEVSVIYSLFM